MPLEAHVEVIIRLRLSPSVSGQDEIKQWLQNHLPDCTWEYLRNIIFITGNAHRINTVLGETSFPPLAYDMSITFNRSLRFEESQFPGVESNTLELIPDEPLYTLPYDTRG